MLSLVEGRSRSTQRLKHDNHVEVLAIRPTLRSTIALVLAGGFLFPPLIDVPIVDPRGGHLHGLQGVSQHCLQKLQYPGEGLP